MPSVAAFLDRYTGYFLEQQPDLEANKFLAPEVQGALEQERAALWRKARRCHLVFDAAFYLAHNSDLQGVVSEADAPVHFDRYGFFERRAYRFSAPPVIGSGEEEGAAVVVGGVGASEATAIVRRAEQEQQQEQQQEEQGPEPPLGPPLDPQQQRDQERGLPIFDSGGDDEAEGQEEDCTFDL